MTSSSLPIQQVWQSLVKHQDLINKTVVLLLSIYLIAYAAALTWRLIPAPDSQQVHQSSSSTNHSVRQKKAAVSDIASIQRLNLFGNAAAPVKVQEPVVSDAPETKLNLTLTGVVASTESQSGAAIIDNRGTQATYGIGDKVEGTNAIVREVFADRIIIRNGTRMETLMLDGVDFNRLVQEQVVATPTRPEVVRQKMPTPDEPKMELRRLSNQDMQATRNLRNKPKNFTDFIAISPVRLQGELKGYRVNPGRNPSLFNASGLKANDIITEINGLDLSDLQQSMQAMKTLRKSDSMQITIDRKGDIRTLYLELPNSDAEEEG